MTNVLFALAEPPFYQKHGFLFAQEHGYHHEWSEYDSLLMVRELIPGSLVQFAGTVDFTPDLQVLK